METQNVRNVAFISHGGAGKTSLAEAVLFNTGVTKKIGEVDNGTTMLDHDPVEISRKITINSSVATIDYKKYQINIIDTPGYANFLHETKVTLAAASGAVVLASAITGVKAETEKVWEFAEEYSLAKLIFINKMDKDRADFFRAVAAVEKTFGVKALPLYLPIGAEDSFRGVVDLITMKGYLFIGSTTEEVSIPEDMSELAYKYHLELLEYASEMDDALIEKYLDSGELTVDEIKRGLREGAITKKFVPVLCGSALKNQGVSQLLDAILEYLPSPKEEPIRVAIDTKSNKEVYIKCTDTLFSAFVFKTLIDPFAGKISMLRIVSGEITSDTEVINSSRGEKEHIAQLFLMQGKNTIKLVSAVAGQIVMVNKLRYTETFDTLCGLNSSVVFPRVEMPDTVISFSIVPKSKDDEDKMSVGVHKLLEEDTGLQVRRDKETGEFLLSGMGQMHIETVVEKLQKKFNVQVEMKVPKVPYRETVKGSSKGQGKYKKQSGGRGQYGDVWLEITPLERGEGFIFEDRVVGGVVPRNYIPAVEKGIREAMLEGVFSGYPMVDFKVALYDGSYHSVDSSEMAFKVAASMAYKKVANEAKPMLLEPIMDMDIFIPEEYVGAVIGDINSRRGRILNVEPQKAGQHIRAQVPMAEVLTYAPDLRSMTGSHGVFSMSFSYYDELPSHLVDKVLNKNKKGD